VRTIADVDAEVQQFREGLAGKGVCRDADANDGFLSIVVVDMAVCDVPRRPCGMLHGAIVNRSAATAPSCFGKRYRYGGVEPGRHLAPLAHASAIMLPIIRLSENDGVDQRPSPFGT